MTNTDSADPTPEHEQWPNLRAMDDRALNQAFDLLRDQRQRYVLETLYATAETTVSVDDIADHVVAHDPDAADRDRVRVGLHHRTLPRLADEGVIDFDPRTDVVRYHGGEPLDDFLAVLAEENETGFRS